MNQRRNTDRRAIATAVLLVCIAIAVPGFDFEPITQDFSPTGPGANHVFRITNTTDERIAVRVSVRSRTVQADGSEVLGPEAEEFVVFPRQVLLQPDERRSVRVRWSGAETVDVELPYRIIAEQLPVDLGGNAPTQGGGIRLNYRYEGTIYVVPAEGEPQVTVSGITRPGGGNSIRVELVNEGQRHTLLNNVRLSLARDPNGDPSIVLGTGQLAGMAGQNMLAQSRRYFDVPVPEGLWDGPVYATIDLVSE